MTSALMMDTQPIAVDDLTEGARETLRDVLEILKKIRTENRGHRHRQQQATGPWASLDHGRTYRVIMLDGPRGSGKTSLLLTLIDQWNRRRDPKNWAGTPPKRELLQDDDAGVQAMAPLDFDPHPEHLHPYAWLVLAFQPVVDWVARSEPHPWRDEPGERKLREAWRELYTQALIGWDANVQRKQMIADIDGFVAATLESHRGWHHLREAWQTFIDDLLAQLERQREIGADDLLVLPIDDLDLHPSMAGDLLRALRLMRHRRLVFVLTGDSDHLRQVLVRELLPANKVEDALEQRREEKVEVYQRLAADIVNKAIPSSCRFSVPLLTLAQALSFVVHGRDIEASMEYKESIEKLLDENLPDRGLVARWIARAGEPNYRYRDVVKVPRTTSREEIEALCLLTRRVNGSLVLHRDVNAKSPQFYRDLEIELQVDASFSDEEVGTSRARMRGAKQSRILLASSLEPVMSRGASVATQGATYLLEYLNPGRVHGVKIVTSEWSEVQVTDWKMSDPVLPARVAWPCARAPRSFSELEGMRRKLGELADGIDQGGKLHPDHGRLLAWCWENVWGGVADSSWLVDVDLWRELDELPMKRPRPRRDSAQSTLDWCEYRLPILAAPEFGLPESAVKAILAWIRRWPGLREPLGVGHIERWELARQEGLTRAFERELGPRAPTHRRVDEALKWLETTFAGHPWYQFVRRPLAEPVPKSLPPSDAPIESPASMQRAPKASKPPRASKSRKPA